MARSVTENILEKKNRGRFDRYSSHHVAYLKLTWERVPDSLKREISDLIPIKLVTLLENVFRGVAADLTDAIPAVKENARKLLMNVSQRDIVEMLLRIDGRQMTVGDVVSNVMRCSRISDIFSNLKELCGGSPRDEIADATECWIEVPANERVKIIKSSEDCFAGIEKLFECRHIIVHEHPKNRPYDIEEIDQMLVNTEQFASALSWFATSKIHGDVPRTQMTMNRQAYDAASKEQEVLYKHIDPFPYVSELMDEYDHHCVWYWFEHLMADARSGLSLGRYLSGSIAPLIYWNEISRLEKWRINDLARFSDFFPAEYFRGGGSS